MPAIRPGPLALLKEMFAEIGENCCIEPPFHANWGGCYVHFGHDVYANFNLTMVDDTHIYVGNNVLFGPNVTLSAGAHPIHPELRRNQAQYNLPIHIGDNVWIGAGSVVTGDIPANVIAVGTPCRVLREITQEDFKFYEKTRPIDL